MRHTSYLLFKPKPYYQDLKMDLGRWIHYNSSFVLFYNVATLNKAPFSAFHNYLCYNWHTEDGSANLHVTAAGIQALSPTTSEVV